MHHTSDSRDIPFELLAGLVLLVCFALSWDVLVQLARASGLNRTLALAYPLSIDLLAAAAYRAALRLQGAPGHIRAVPLAVTITFVGLSVLGNALHAWAPLGGQLVVPRAVAAAVTAVPPLSGAVIVHLYALVRRYGAPTEGTAVAAEKRIEREAPAAVPASAAGAEQLTTPTPASQPPAPRPRSAPRPAGGPRETPEQAAERLLAPALAAAAAITSAGETVNRRTLGAALRDQGHALSTTAAQILAVRVRTHSQPREAIAA
ncbi:hypothetical protein [Protofrankia coriariae]|uniref:DUF2637 domain-containing protein n=1 Tax=Protofrankia coriariae TaxID=1562887 RepID=A0ABR5F4A1_9ACTN|nr:hypothetical protein [Protofrankia coriariae]KLL11559.1 hypothetical protein FrCorBMG51_11000 [Protofrankia coriariae]